MTTHNSNSHSSIGIVLYNAFWFQVITFLIIVAFLTFAPDLFAATKDERNTDGKQFADSINSGIGDKAKNTDTSNIPQYQGENVPARDYYNSGAGIEDEALVNSLTDPTSNYVNESRNNRPQFNIDTQNDPLFKREDDIVSLSRSLTDTYSGCVALPVGNEDVTEYDRRECLVHGRQDTVNYTCQRNLNVSCSNANAGQPWPYSIGNFEITGGDDSPYSQSGDTFSFGSNSNNHGGDCTRYYRTIRFYVPDRNLITQFSFDQINYDDWLDIVINGSLSYRGVGPHQGTHVSGTFNCEMGRNYTGTSFDALSRIRTGWNTIQVTNLIGGRGHYHFRFTLRRIRGCDQVSEITYQCPTGESHITGTLLSSTCVSSGWRTINNVQVYRSCWQWSQNYTRLTDPIFTRDPECDAIEQQGCGQVASDCIVNGPGYCTTRRLSYDCPRIEAARHVNLCGDILTCPDGNCTEEYKTQKDATEDFKEAATSLAVAGEIAKEFDYDNLSVFKGDGKKCDRSVAGFANCCKDGGWGTDVGLDNCSTEEKELGIKREQEAAHYIGNYCSQDSILGCLKRTYTYCTYPSKLARIIVEQGSSQMGRGYGSARNPDCPGFTIDELNSLDFNAMNLTEFYDDVAEKAAAGTVGDPNQLIQDIADRLNQMGGGQ